MQFHPLIAHGDSGCARADEVELVAADAVGIGAQVTLAALF